MATTPLEAQNAQPISPACQNILKRFRRTLEQCRSSRLFNCHVRAADLRVVHLFVVHQVSAGVDDRHRDIPVIFLRFGKRRSSRLSGVLPGDRPA
jgi:hypothetical protein